MREDVGSANARENLPYGNRNRGIAARRMTACIAALLLCAALIAVPARALAQSDAAADLTRDCKLSASFSSSLFRLTNGDKQSAQRIPAGKSVTVSWAEGVPAATVFFAFYTAPVAHTVLQHDAEGTLLSEEAGVLLWNNAVALLEGARSVTIRAGETELVLCTLAVYGEGEIPDYHPWQPTPEKADYLLIAMHPDDDALFLGAVIPIYGAEQGREGVALYMATRIRQRIDEALNGAWTMGLRTLPIMGGFPDIPPDYREKHEKTFQRADVVRYLVRQMRKLQPEVVVSQDLNGEYGHWQHVLLANAVLEAAPLAADASYDPQSVNEYGVWEVKKVYLHLYAEGAITLPVTQPLNAFGGKTAVEVAAAAFACHVSQLPSRHSVTNEGIYSLSDFGLAYTTVGADSPGVNDLFEHIDPATLHAQITPEPMATPEPSPTAEPPVATDPPRTEPPQITRQPVSDPTALPATAAGEMNEILLFVLLALVLVVAALLAALLIRRARAAKRRKKKRG